MLFIKPISVFLLVSSILLPKQILHFTIHLPDIIEHFEEHKKSEHSDIFEFISSHLTTNKKESKEHSNLPLNHEHSNLPDLQISMFNINLSQSFNLIIPNNRTIKIPALAVFKYSNFLTSIFQPPKGCKFSFH